MGEVDWDALSREVGDPPPPPPQAVRPSGVNPEILRRVQELHSMLPPGAHLELNLPTGAGDSSPRPLSDLVPPGAAPSVRDPQLQGTPPPAAAPAVAPAPPAAAPASGLDWNALAAEVGDPPPPPPAPPQSGFADSLAAGMTMAGNQAAGAGGNPLDHMRTALEGLKVPPSMTLAGAPSPTGTPEQEAAKANAEATGRPVMTASPPEESFPHQILSALHGYFSAKMRTSIGGNDQALEEAKAKLRDSVMPIAQAGGTAWNGVVSMAQQVPDFAEALKDSTMGLLGAVSASAAGAAGMPGATPDVVKQELERSRAGTEKAGETAMGLARAPIDPWFYAATDQAKFVQMVKDDPITTAAMMLPGLHGALKMRPGEGTRVALSKALPEIAQGKSFDLKNYSMRELNRLEDLGLVKEQVASGIEGGPVEGLWKWTDQVEKALREQQAKTRAGIQATEVKTVEAKPVERRAQPSPAPRQDVEALVAEAEKAGTPEAHQAAHKGLYDTVHEIMQRDKVAPEDIDTVFLRSQHLKDLNDRLYEVQTKLAEKPTAPAPEVLHGVQSAEGKPVVVKDLTDEQLAQATKHMEDLIKGREEAKASGGFPLGGDFPEGNLDKLRREAERRKAPVPPAPAEPVNFKYVGKMDTKAGPIHYWQADKPMPITGDKGRVTAEMIRKNGLEVPPVPGEEVKPAAGPGGVPAESPAAAPIQPGPATPTEPSGPSAMKPRNTYTLDGTGRNFDRLGLERYRTDLLAELRRTGKGARADSLEKLSLEQFANQGGYVLKREKPATSTEHAVGESLRVGKQRVVVKAVLRDAEGILQGYRVKGKRDLPFVIKASDAKPWGDIVSKKVPGLKKVGELSQEDLGNTEVVARWIKENGGLKLDGDTRNLAESLADKESGLSHVKGVVHKLGRSLDSLAEDLADSGPFRDREHAKDWLEEWVYNQGSATPSPEETRFLERAGDQGGRFGVDVPARRARLAAIGRDLNPLVVNPREGQKGSLKVGDVVMTSDDVFRVKADPQNPGKLMLKDGRTIRPEEGQSVKGVKLGKMPVRTREELRAAGRPVSEEIRANARGEAPVPSAEPGEHDALRDKIADLKELEDVVTPTPDEKNPAKNKLLKGMADDRREIEMAFDKIENEQGRDAADALRERLGWDKRDEDVLAEARRKTDEAKARAERVAEADKKRAKDVKGGQRSMIDEETNQALDEEAAAKEQDAKFKSGQGEIPFYPNPQEGTTRAAARPVPLDKDLRPRRREAVVRAQDIKRRFEKAILAPIRYGVGRKKARGFFRTFERVVRTKKYLDLPVDFHEGGHAIQQLLWPEINQISGKTGFDIKGPNSKIMRKELSKLGHALYDPVGKKPVGGYKSEGLAEFVRIYIEDGHAGAKKAAPVFYEEFQRRLLQDADTIDLGRMLDETMDDYARYRLQPSVAKALSRISIGEGKPLRWSLDRISSALLDNQAFIKAYTRALNGGELPPEGLGNPITHAKLLRGWTGLAEAALGRGGGVADFRTARAFEKKFQSLGDILAKPGVADKPLPFVSEAVRAFEDMTPSERLLRRMTNVFQDADNMRGLDSLRAYWYARRTLSIAEGDTARALVKKSPGQISDAAALKYVQQNPHLVKEGGYRDTGLSLADARQVIKDIESPELQQAVAELTQYANHVLHWYVEEGMWTEEQYQRVIRHPANLVYMPLDRWFSEYGDRGGEGFRGRSMSGAQVDVGRLKGSDVPIIDPFETTVANTYHVAQTVQRNRAMRMIVEYAAKRPGSGWAAELVGKPITQTKFALEELRPQIEALVRKGGGDPSLLTPEDFATMGRIYRPALKVKAGKNLATYYSKGKEMVAEMDHDVYRAVAGLDQEALNSYLKVFGAPARWVRAGATLTPEFLLRNLFRDPITASILSETGGINPFSGAVPGVTTARGVKEMLKRGDMAFRYRASGAAHAAMVSMDRDYLRGQARQLLTDDTALRKIAGVVHHPVEILKALGELGETGTRLGVFARELDASGITHDNILRASVKSREGTTDFNVYGTVLEPFARTVPFLNPGIQSVRRFGIVTGRALSDIAKSAQALGRGELRSPEYAASYASRVLTYAVAPSVALHFMRKQAGRQEEYLELPAWRRHLFWNVPLPKSMAKTWGFNWLSVPKPFEIGVLYGTGTEVLLEQMEHDDPKALDEYKDSLIGAFTPNVIPAFLNASVENLANRKIAFDRPIMPASQESLEPELQYGLYTSDTAKLGAAGIRKLPSLVGKPVAFVINLSGSEKSVNAYDVDNVIKSLTAGLGQYYVTPALDFVIRRLVGGTDEGERLGIGTAASTKLRASDIPVIRGFIPRGNEVGGGLIERTYQDIAEGQTAWNTYNALDGWRMDEYLQDPEKRRLIVGHHVLQDVRDGLANVNKLVLAARKAGDEELVDHLRDLAVDMARNTKQRIDEAMKDPTAMNAIAIEHELSNMRNEKSARHAEAATVLEGMVEEKTDDAKIRTYLETMTGEDRRWAVKYTKDLKRAQKLSAEREALKKASRHEKLQLKKEGMLP